jgi:ABC-2 type transport system permease protein
MNTFTICNKELQSYFRSPIAYTVIALWALIGGFFFYFGLSFFVQRSMEGAMTGQSFPMDINEWIVRPLLSNVNVVALFLIPMITMRLFAEEKRSGTIELLMTSPINDIEIVLGKWLAAVGLYSIMLLVSVLHMAILFRYGQPDWRPLAVGYLGLLLQGGCLLAIGTFVSTCTSNQIVAGALGFAISLLLFVLNWVSEFGSSVSERVIGYLSVQQHFESFSKGVLDSKDIIFYVTMIILGLFLTSRSLESVRWRA